MSWLWAGRALKILNYAQIASPPHTTGILSWKELKNTCVVCMKPTTLTVQWEGPGQEKPIKARRTTGEFKEMYYKPMKVMDAYVCGMCRVTCLPRLKIVTQWDLRGTPVEPRECSCRWDGERLQQCNMCLLCTRNGRLLGRQKGGKCEGIWTPGNAEVVGRS